MNKSLNKLSRTIEIARHLDEIAKKLHKQYKYECNFQESTRRTNKIAKLEGQAIAAAKHLKCKVAFCGDPRGASFALYRGKNKTYYELNDCLYF